MLLSLRVPAVAVALLVVGAVSANAFDRRVVIVNKTSATINEFYASNTGARNWQEDIFGTEALPSGHEVTINIDDGSGFCKYDFRAVFEDGSESVQRGVNVCEVARFSFRD